MRTLFSAVLLASIALAGPVSGQTVQHVFVPPEPAVADPDGYFVVDLHVILGTGGGSLAYTYLQGLENCSTNVIGDAFCLVQREEGETISVVADGRLVNPEAPGRVYVEISICSEQDTNFWTAEVDVEPFTVPTEKDSIGRVKAGYSQ